MNFKIRYFTLRLPHFVQLGQIENGANERAIRWKYQHCFFVYTIIDSNLKNLTLHQTENQDFLILYKFK